IDAPPRALAGVAPGLPIGEFAGQLTLEGEARYDAKTRSVSSSVRASLAKVALRLVPGDHRVDDAACELDARFDGRDLWRRESWRVASGWRATWLGSPAYGWVVLGKALPDDELARVWGRIERLPWSAQTVEALSHADEARLSFQAYQP